MAKVSPAVLVWARETAGFSREEAAGKLGLSAEEKLQAFETGEKEPTRKQLETMAIKYHRPLLSLYLPKPPSQAPRGEDFRTLSESETAAGSEAILNALLRDVQARQQLVKAALEEADEATPVDFVGSARISDGADAIAAAVRSRLNFSPESFGSQKSVTDAFAYLRNKTEEAGVFVLLMGNLGTHHTNIDVSVFRGFALSDSVAPFIVINETDSKAAWAFTLIHELTHIWLGQTGISGYGSEKSVEKLCDEVAARVLLDVDELASLVPRRASIEELIAAITDFSARRKVSRKMIAYNLLQFRTINGQTYFELAKIFDAERRALAEKKEDRDGGPNYYVVRRHRIGWALINTVKRMVADGVISTTKASKVLGVKPTAVSKLMEPA